VFFDSAKGTQLRSLTVHTGMEQKAIYSLAISPDGKSVVTASSDQTLKLSEVESGKLIREFKAYKEKEFEKGHRDSVLAVAFSPDGKQIVSGGMDKTVKIWDVASGTVVREMINPGFKIEMGQPPLAHPGWVNGVIWTASNKIVSAGNAPRLKGYLAIWDAGSGKMLSGRELDIGAIHGVAISADEKKIALATGGSVRAERDLNVIQVIEGLSK
jgi:tricorn protease-like protein